MIAAEGKRRQAREALFRVVYQADLMGETYGQAWAAAACVTASVGLNVTGVDADAAVSGGAPVAASGTAETIRVRGGTAASGTGVGTLMSPRVTTIKPALPMTKSTAAISNGIDRLIGS